MIASAFRSKDPLTPDLYYVVSQDGQRLYQVDASVASCSCPARVTCKHVKLVCRNLDRIQ